MGTGMRNHAASGRAASGAAASKFVRAKLALVLACGLAFLGAVGTVRSQTQSQAPAKAPLAFDVASIKPSGDIMAIISAGKMPNIGVKVDAQRVTAGYLTLAQLITYAYKVKPYQVSGPDWMKTAHWDIEATLPDGAKEDQVPEMMQTLLADRFKLVIHHDSKDLPVLALEVGKNGVKMQPSPPDPAPSATPAPDDKDTTVVKGPDGSDMKVKTTGRMGEGGSVQVSGGRGGPVKVSMDNGMMHMEATKMTMDLLTQQLTAYLNQPVIDKTELKGSYVVALDLSIDDLRAIAASAGFGAVMGGGPAPAQAGSSATPTASDPSGGSVYQSIEKLGLKLSKEKLPVEMIVVDHLEKTPTEN